MSSCNCCFLTYIQISQEADQVFWYSHPFQNFPQFIVIHTVKGFGIVNKAEIDVFVEFSCFFHDPADVGNLISGSSAFSKTSLNITLVPGLQWWALWAQTVLFMEHRVQSGRLSLTKNTNCVNYNCAARWGQRLASPRTFFPRNQSWFLGKEELCSFFSWKCAFLNWTFWIKMISGADI